MLGPLAIAIHHVAGKPVAVRSNSCYGGSGLSNTRRSKCRVIQKQAAAKTWAKCP